MAAMKTYPPTLTMRFAEAARSLGRAARLRGLEVPTFRSPTGLTGVQRTIRRRGRAATISVVLRGRPWQAVLADMIEGIWSPTGSTTVMPTWSGQPCGWR